MLLEIISSFSLILGLLYILKISYNMPYYGNFWASPGVFPIILCISLLCFSLWWFISAIKKLKLNTNTNIKESIKYTFQINGEKKKLYVIISLTLLYVYVLIPLIKFIPSTLIFLIISTKTFTKVSWLKLVVISIIIVALIYIVFKYILNLPLP
jgi:putative tricarboxylic transport membrane protein